MQLSELILYFRQQLCPGDGALPDAELATLLTEAQKDVTLDLGHPRETTTIISVVGQRYYDLPAKALQILDNGGVSYNGIPLTYITINELNLNHSGWKIADNGMPKYYFQDRLGKIGLYPKPDTADKDIEETHTLISDDMDSDTDQPFTVNGAVYSQLSPAHKLLAIKVAIGQKYAVEEFLQADRFEVLYEREKNKVKAGIVVLDANRTEPSHSRYYPTIGDYD